MTAWLEMTNKSSQGFYYGLFEGLTLPYIEPHDNVAVILQI